MSDKILNPATGKWVLKTGKIGQMILKQQQTAKGSKKNCDSKSPKASDGKYICNPATGNWVLKTGAIGKLLIGGSAPYTTPSGHPSGAAQKGKSPDMGTKGNSDTKGKLPVKIKKGKLPVKSIKGKSPSKSKQVKSPSKSKQVKSPVKSPCNPNNAKYKLNPNLYVCNAATKNWVLKTSAIGKKILNVGKPPKEPKPKPPKPKLEHYKTTAKSLKAIQDAPAKVLLPNKTCDPNDDKYKANPTNYVCNKFTGNWIPLNTKKGQELQKLGDNPQAVYHGLTGKIVKKNQTLYKVLLEAGKSKSPIVQQLSPTPHKYHPTSAIFCKPNKYGQVFKKQLHYVANLSKPELTALIYYTGSGYSPMNNCLRFKKNEICSQGVKNYINIIDEIFANAPPLEKDIVLYRNYGGFKIKKHKKHIEKAYSSTTAKNYTFHLNQGNLIEVHVPKGTKVIPLISCSKYESEIEVLLPRNLEYKRVANNIYSAKTLPITKL